MGVDGCMASKFKQASLWPICICDAEHRVRTSRPRTRMPCTVMSRVYPYPWQPETVEKSDRFRLSFTAHRYGNHSYTSPRWHWSLHAWNYTILEVRNTLQALEGCNLTCEDFKSVSVTQFERNLDVRTDVPGGWWSSRERCSSCTFPAGASVCGWNWSCTRTWATLWCGRRTCRSRTWRTPSPPSPPLACRRSTLSSNTLSSLCVRCSRI